MKEKKKSIAVDMDGVIADTVSQFIIWYKRDKGIELKRSDFNGKPESEALPGGIIWKFVNTKGFFRDVPVMPGAVEALRRLTEQYDVYVVSAAMEFRNSLYDKSCWLEDHFPFISWKNIVFCGSKSIIGTDYLIDDHLKNLDHFSGKSILFTAGHNLHAQHHLRVNDWQEATDYLVNRVSG